MQWYDTYLDEHLTAAERSLMPNHHDASMLPSLLSLAQADDAQGSVPHEAFLALTDRMLVDAEAYKERVKRSLAAVVTDVPWWNPQTCDELKGLPADDVLQRFCAYFLCREGCVTLDDRSYLTYDEVHAHWQTWHPDEPWFCQAVENIGDVAPVAALAVLLNALAVRHALEAVGIPLETPRSVLDEWTREGRLFCSCEHPDMPLPAEMSWGKLVSAIFRRSLL